VLFALSARIKRSQKDFTIKREAGGGGERGEEEKERKI